MNYLRQNNYFFRYYNSVVSDRRFSPMTGSLLRSLPLPGYKQLRYALLLALLAMGFVWVEVAVLQHLLSMTGVAGEALASQKLLMFLALAALCLLLPVALVLFMRQRVEAIAQGLVSPSSKLSYLLTDAHSSSVPTSVTQVQQEIDWRLGFAIQSVLTLPAALVARLAQDWVGLNQGLVYGAGAIATVTLFLWTTNIGSVWGYQSLRQRLSQKLHQEGIQPEAWEGVFVGLSPENSPKLYDNMAGWDLGFLFLSSCAQEGRQREWLSYVGEQTRFSLQRDQITAIRMGAGLPGWLQPSRVYIHWNAGDRAGVFNLLAIHPTSLRQVSRNTRRLHRRLEAWWQATDHAALACPLRQLPPPQISVIGRNPLERGNRWQFLSQLLNYALLATLVSLLLQLPLTWGGIGYVLLVALAGAIAQLIPYWHYRRYRHQVESW